VAVSNPLRRQSSPEANRTAQTRAAGDSGVHLLGLTLGIAGRRGAKRRGNPTARGVTLLGAPVDALVGRPCAKNKLVPYISAQTMLVGETANSTRRNRSSTLHQHGIDRFVAPVTVHQLSSRLLEIVRGLACGVTGARC